MVASPTIEHVTVVTEAGWLNPVISLAGVALTALVSWLIYRGNVARAEERARREESRHFSELRRLRRESRNAETRHRQQINMMLAQGRREREVRFLRELSDQLILFADAARTVNPMFNEGYAIRLNQFSYKVLADFSEDDYEFATALSSTLSELGNQCLMVLRSTEFPTNDGALERLAVDSEETAYHMLRWLHPDFGRTAVKEFQSYLEFGRFFRADES